ncbi:MAG: hypothetical protein ACFNVU_09880 [Haemophilus seminalis]
MGASSCGEIVGEAVNSVVGTIVFRAISGGVGAELTGGNFWQGALIGGFVSGLNHVAHQIVSSTNRPSKSNRRLERLERQGKVRSLTENEIALAKSVFDDEIDYQSVKIVRAKYVFTQGKYYAVTPNGNIYYPTSEADWTNPNGTNSQGNLRDLFIHELTHVWQYQNSINVLMKALPLQILKFGTLGLIDPCILPQNNINFQSLNVEQQGSYMEGVLKVIYNNPFNK